LRRKERIAAEEFLAEGPQSVAEALATGDGVRRVLVSENAVDVHQDLLNAAVRAGVPVSTVAIRAFADLSDTVTPQGVLAVCRSLDLPLTEALHPEAKLVACATRSATPATSAP